MPREIHLVEVSLALLMGTMLDTWTIQLLSQTSSRCYHNLTVSADHLYSWSPWYTYWHSQWNSCTLNWEKMNKVRKGYSAVSMVKCSYFWASLKLVVGFFTLFCFLFFFPLPGVEPMALFVLGKCSPTKLIVFGLFHFILRLGLPKLPRLGLTLPSSGLSHLRSWEYRCVPQWLDRCDTFWCSDFVN